MKKSMLLIAACVLADQGIKALVRLTPLGTVIWRADALLEIVHVRNTGAAFSLMDSSPMLVTMISAVLVAALGIAVLGRMRLTAPARVAAALVLGGGLGNLIDRMLYGAVTDYIRLLLLRFPVFNLADILISASTFVLLILLFSGKLEQPDTGDAHVPES